MRLAPKAVAVLALLPLGVAFFLFAVGAAPAAIPAAIVAAAAALFLGMRFLCRPWPRSRGGRKGRITAALLLALVALTYTGASFLLGLSASPSSRSSPRTRAICQRKCAAAWWPPALLCLFAGGAIAALPRPALRRVVAAALLLVAAWMQLGDFVFHTATLEYR